MTDWPLNLAYWGIVTVTVLFLVFAFRAVEKPTDTRAPVRVRRRRPPPPPQQPGGKRE